MSPNKKNIYEKLGKLGQDDDKALDYAYWDQQGDSAKLKAAWDLVIQAYKIKGMDLDELRFQRSVEKFHRI